MKKSTLFLMACISAMTLDAQKLVVTPVWQDCDAAGTLPAWFSKTSNLTRGIGASSSKVYVATRDGVKGKNIYVYNAATGAYVDTLKNTASCVGGRFDIDDVGCTNDGKVITASMAMVNAATPIYQDLRIYMYNETNQNYDVICEVPAVTVRLGDIFTVTGDYSKGTARIWFASAPATSTSSVPSVIFYLGMTGGQWNTSLTQFSTLAITSGATAGVVNPSLAVKPDGSMYWKGAGGSGALRYIDSNGQATFANNKNWSWISNTIKYLGYNSTTKLDYFAAFTYGSAIKRERADILSVDPTDIAGTCKVIDSTAVLGTNPNVGGTGDIAVRYDANNNPIVYVLSTNNGFAAYKIEGLGLDPASLTSGLTNATTGQVDITTYPNPATDVVYVSETAKTIKLVSATGQLIKEAFNANELNVNGLHGIFLMEIKTDNGCVVKKVVVK